MIAGITRPVVLAGGLVILVATGLVVAGVTGDGGVTPPLSEGDAARTIEAIYAGDPPSEALLDVAAPGSIPAEERDEVAAGVDATLAPGVTVTDSDTVVVRGTTLQRVDTSDGLVWCVRPDGRVLLQCRVGAVQPRGVTIDPPLELRHLSIDIYPDRVDIVAQVGTTGSEPVRLAGHLDMVAITPSGEAVDPPVTVAEYYLLREGERDPVDDEDVELAPDADLLVYYLLPASADAATFVTNPELALVWSGGRITVGLSGADWFT